MHSVARLVDPIASILCVISAHSLLYGGGTLVSGVTGIPLFYDWVPYHYGVFKVLMVALQPIFDGYHS